MADWAVLAEKLNQQVLASFGREVIYSPQLGAPFTVRAILDSGVR